MCGCAAPNRRAERLQDRASQRAFGPRQRWRGWLVASGLLRTQVRKSLRHQMIMIIMRAIAVMMDASRCRADFS